jgi:hypothetical protein
MRTLVFLAALLLTPAANAQRLEDLHWLKGCWRSDGDGPAITEVWLAPPMPALIGYAYTMEDGALLGWEQTRIEVIDGLPHFIAMPNGGAPVRFPMTQTEAGRVTFENPEHDFPQRVSYARTADRLSAEISRLDGANAIAFTYRRIRCPANLRP